MKPLAVLRPEPGNAATAARIAAAGGTAIRLPLFVVRPLDWTAPDPAEHDALLLTSANALRHAGAALATLAALPVHAVGQATAGAAMAANLRVVTAGDGDAMALAAAAGARRALHLAGRDRATATLPGVSRTIAVYASEPVTPDPAMLAALSGAVVLVHSPRAGARLAELVVDRAGISVAAISEAAATAVGPGWAKVVVAARPDDAALVQAALALA